MAFTIEVVFRLERLHSMDGNISAGGTDILCECLDWDSDFFDRRIARIIVGRLQQEAMSRIMKWCRSQQIDCLYWLADADDLVTVRLAEDNRFRMVDIRVTLEKQLEGVLGLEKRVVDPAVRFCAPHDVATLKDIARVSHRDSRFYYDPNFPVSRCNAFYEVWIEKSCAGYANVVLIAECQGQPVGYITCDLLDHHDGRIGLFAVSAEVRSEGFGEKLIKQSLRWFVEQGIESVSVVTQGRNCGAQRLYQKCGFLSRSVQVWYHRWFL